MRRSAVWAGKSARKLENIRPCASLAVGLWRMRLHRFLIGLGFVLYVKARAGVFISFCRYVR